MRLATAGLVGTTLIGLLSSLSSFAAIVTKVDCTALPLMEINAETTPTGLANVKVWAYGEGKATQVNFDQDNSKLTPASVVIDKSYLDQFDSGWGVSGEMSVSGSAYQYDLGSVSDERGGALTMIFESAYKAKVAKGYVDIFKADLVHTGDDAPTSATQLSCEVYGEQR